MGGRHHYLARELAKRGHRVYLIAADWHHLLNENSTGETTDTKEAYGYSFVRVPVLKYADAHDKRRILNWFLFSWRLRKLRSQIADQPDAILYSSPSPIGFLGAEWLAKKTGARLVFEVRDIWPLTLIEVGNHSPRHPLVRIMQWVEDRAYRNADAVVSNLQFAFEHMESRGMSAQKFTWVPNGISKDEVETSEPLSAETSSKLPQGKFIVGYAGTIGAANSMGILIKAAQILRNETDIAFVLVGQGREKKDLQNEVKQSELENVYFIDAIPKKQIQTMLSHFDVCFLAWQKSALYKFGTSANKLFDYLYSARPVLNSYTGAGDVVIQYGAGLSTEAQDSEAVAKAILTLRDMPESERTQMGKNGRKSVLEYHEYGSLAKKMEQVLFDDVGDKKSNS